MSWTGTVTVPVSGNQAVRDPEVGTRSATPVWVRVRSGLVKAPYARTRKVTTSARTAVGRMP